MPTKPPKPEGVRPVPRYRKWGKNKNNGPKPALHKPLSAATSFKLWSTADNADPRTAAIVAAGFLEHNLALAILGRLKVISERDQKSGFEGTIGVLHTFNSKIQMGFFLNLYDDDVRSDLDLIRDIRNKFAHRIDIDSFDHDEIKQQCDQLFGPRYLAYTSGAPERSDRRQRFIDTADHLTERFAYEAKNIQRPPEATMKTYESMPKPSPDKPEST
jgi:hypothetical protein